MYKTEIKICGTTGTSQTLRHKDSYSNSYLRKIQIYTQRGHRPISTSCGSEVVLSNNKIQIWPKRPTNKQPSQLVLTSQAATWEPRTTRRHPRRTHLCARCRPPLKQFIKQQRETEYDVLASLVGRYRPNDDGGSKAV